MRTRNCFLLFSLMLPAMLTVSCGSGGDARSDLEAIRALDAQWSATAAKNDVDGAVAFYADDAVLLPPNAPMATDRKSIREAWAGMLGPNTAVSWKVSKAEVAKSGDLGYLYGTYSLMIGNS